MVRPGAANNSGSAQRTGLNVSAGSEFVGNYRLYHLIRAGAIYEIWAVRPMSETTPYAMKWVSKSSSRYSRTAVSELKHEYTVGKSLTHPQVIKTHEFGDTKAGAFLLMEFFKTPNLKQQIVAGHKNLLWRAKQVLVNAAAGLNHMHEQGWVHRDIKPDNYLVRDDNEVRLIDFTIAAKPVGALGRLFGGAPKVQGTYSYMSPEQIRGLSADPRDDVYSFGCLVYELLSGKLPFTANSPQELLQRHLKGKPPSLTLVDKNIQPPFAELVQRMLSKDRSERPANMKDVMFEIKAQTMFYTPPKPPEADPAAPAKE